MDRLFSFALNALGHFIILETLCIYRFIEPDSEWRLHRYWFDRSAVADGLVVTNYHVIQGASHLTARTNEGAVFQFQRVLAHPQDVALAILKFAADGAAYLKLGQSTDAVEKQRALVIGSHEGLEETVSEGSISAFRPNRSMIQITAPISPESSGSPGNKRIGSGDWCCNNGD